MSPDAALARATAFYEAGEYEACAEAFAAQLDDASQAALLSRRAREQARVYRAACLIAQGKIDLADDEFRVAVRENPQMAVPNAIVFPPTVIERFVVVRTGMMEEIRRAEEERARLARDAALAAQRRAEEERLRVAELERLARQETLVVRNRRWIASVPFGVGQFQNRQYLLGTVFLASEAVLLGTAITAVTIELSLHSQANGGRNLSSEPAKAEAERDALNQNLRTANTVALASTGALLGVAALGIVEANLSFVPEFHDGYRIRPVPTRKPPRATVAPLAEPLTGGAVLGVQGRF
jgi:tetratricopeptide (TPR) repeat protein